MLKIWGRASAFNVQKAMWAVGEVGVAYERYDVGGAFGGLDDPDYRAMNPNGRIPTIDDGGVVVWESHAIIRYLAARYGDGTLWNPDPARRAVSDQWMDWMQSTGLVRAPEDQRDWPTIHATNERLAKHYEILDRNLASRPYLAGNDFSIADIPAGTTLYRYYEMEIERPRLDHLRSWYERLAERPAYRSHVMIAFDDLRGRTTY
jgi:glutathione S-transferase